jgi:hypothetical protein
MFLTKNIRKRLSIIITFVKKTIRRVVLLFAIFIGGVGTALIPNIIDSMILHNKYPENIACLHEVKQCAIHAMVKVEEGESELAKSPSQYSVLLAIGEYKEALSL